MIRKLVLIAFVLLSAGNILKAQVVYFNGLGRALVTTDNIGGVAMDPDPAAGLTDTINPRSGTGGYTIFDLGVNAQPNENLRAHALLRIRNEFGGFYGDGSFLEFRQLRLDGVLGKVFKYEIGDVDLMLTPYTLYNFEEMYNDFEADVFAIRRSIVHYENFNFGNKWRLQGFNGSAAFQYEKGIERLGFRAFATRTNRTNFLNVPDRVLAGGRIDVKQSKYLSVGLNATNFFDIVTTVPSDLTNYNNRVFTGDFASTLDLDAFRFKLFGEGGLSNYSYDLDGVNVTRTDDNYFYDMGLSGEYKPLQAKVAVSYRNVQPDFLSPGAQTRRIFDGGIGDLDHQIYPFLGNQEVYRNPMLFDRITQEYGLRNLTIQPTLMPFLPQYNNITPYGTATPNRQGFTATVSAGEDDKILKFNATADLLTEIVGVGSPGTRTFTGLRGGMVLNVNRILGWEKAIALNGGIRYEDTRREQNPINFQSTLYDAGLSIEVLTGLDILGGYKLLVASGNEFVPVYDSFNFISDYDDLSLDLTEDILAFGVRYRFSNNSYFTFQGHFAGFTNRVNITGDERFPGNYSINQAFLNYTMVF
ncbi:hypothetical protein RCC89_18660 [Cytophagaceae bacterium ABcell3]|nr:hypothetical protein RCC89_18660 [Cytophagaceae bacterium ABcell3]